MRVSGLTCRSTSSSRTDHLLGYHVGLLLIPVSLVLLVWRDPAALLLQALFVGLGLLPAFSLAAAAGRRQPRALFGAPTSGPGAQRPRCSQISIPSR